MDQRGGGGQETTNKLTSSNSHRIIVFKTRPSLVKSDTAWSVRPSSITLGRHLIAANSSVRLCYLCGLGRGVQFQPANIYHTLTVHTLVGGTTGGSKCGQATFQVLLIRKELIEDSSTTRAVSPASLWLTGASSSSEGTVLRQ